MSLKRTSMLVVAALVAVGWAVGVDAREEDQPFIVHLVDDAASVTPLERAAGVGDLKRVDEVEGLITAAIDDLIRQLPEGDLAVRRTFRLQPAFSAWLSDDARAILERHPMVRAIEPDRMMRLATEEGLEVIGADVLQGLGIAGEGTAVAIVDSGVDYFHPTLGGGQIPNVKVIYGLDTADGDGDPLDCNGHGTAVASVAAGSSYQWSPSRRFAGGVAPAAMILAYKVTSDANCEAASTSAVIEAIEDAVLRRDGDGYRLAAINISLGAGAFSGPCDADNLAYSQAVVAATEAGVPVIAAAGNAGYGSALNVPACLSDAIAVGSVWDTDPGLDGSSFCLDPECTTFCDDGNQWRTAVACYSNSGRQLDVLAPAEYLKAAASGAITIDFGGTSGAAAYAAGSAALLSQAFPGITPNEVSLLLRATGRPTMDDKNGLIRPIIDLAQAIDTVPVVAVAPDHGLPIAPEGGSPTVSEVVIESNGTVGSVRVLVDLEHPDPERLQLALEAPDGTRIVLLDPDASDPADLGDGFSPDGIVATFPDDIEPAESLGRLANIPISGVWTLSINDLRSTAAPGDARLMGWALAVEPPDSPGAATSMVIPVVAHTGGVADTAWRSDIRLFNPSRDHDALVRLFFVEGSTEDGAPSSRQTDVVVPHRSTVALDDIVLHRFAVDSGRGSLVVDDPSGCVARGTSRTYTVGDNGSFGQFVPPTVAGERSTGAGEPALVVLPTTGNDHRVNLGFTEIVGGSATVAVTVIDAVTGVAIGPSTFHAVDPHGNLQINGLLPHPERPEIADAYIVVTVVHGDGRITAYASVVDNRTGDAVFVRGATPMITSALTVPVVARTDGLSGTRWRSDLRLLNHGSFSVHIDAELRLQGAFGIPPLIESLELQPGESITIDDVVGDFFGVDDAVGSLRLVPQEGPAALCASSRTANHGSDGSYGQHVPAIQAGRGLERLGTVLHLSSSAVSRSNLGIVETAGDDVDLEIRLRDRKGHQIGTTRRTGLGPFESVQFNDIFSSLLAAPADNVRVEIQRIAGSGRWFAYGSVIDARSGDAIFVPVADAEDCSLTN